MSISLVNQENKLTSQNSYITENNYFNKLPDEILLEIFKNLPSMSDLYNISLVDSRFYIITKDRRIIISVKEEEIKSYINLMLPEEFRQQFLQSVQRFYNDKMGLLSQKYPNLKKNRIITLLYIEAISYEVQATFRNKIRPSNEPMENISSQLLSLAVYDFVEAPWPMDPDDIITKTYKELFDSFFKQMVSSRALPHYYKNAQSFYNKLSSQRTLNSVTKSQQLLHYLKDIGVPRDRTISKFGLLSGLISGLLSVLHRI